MITFEMLDENNVYEVWELEKLCFADPWELGAFESELSNRISVYIVARDAESGAVVGYGGVWMMYDCANITNIAVAPDYRRGGLGGEILRLLTEVSRENAMDSITLEVRVSNEAAIALYKKYGFEQCGLRKRYYKDNEDAVLMTKMICGNATSL